MATNKRLLRDIRLGINTLLLHKLRSSLTMLGIVFGVGSVVAMLAIGEGASQEALEHIRKLGSRNIIIRALKPADENQQELKHSVMSVYGLHYADEQRISESSPHIKRTIPAKIFNKTVRSGGNALEARVVGTIPDWFEFLHNKLIAGRTITQKDMEQQHPICILSEDIARPLLAQQHSIGAHIKIGNDYFEVVGIVASSASSTGGVESPSQPRDIYIPLTVCKKYFGDRIQKRVTGSRELSKVELHQIIAEVSDDSLVESTAVALNALLSYHHPKHDYEVSVPLSLLQQAEATKRTFTIVLGSIAGISLIVGGIGIMNIMLASVTERTREIGIRRAIGARKKDIIRQFLIETIVLSMTGGILGIGFGVLVPLLVEQWTDMPTVIPVYAIWLSLGISVLVGVIFGMYPARKAASLNPIEALRHE